MIQKLTTPASTHHQSGLSLVEIMIAITLSMVLMAGIIQIYAGNKATNTMQGDLVQLQDNARFSLELLSRDLRMADSAACIRLSAANASGRFNNMLGVTPDELTAGGIQGWEAAGTNAAGAPLAADLYAANRVPVDIGGGWLAAAAGNANLAPIGNAVPNSDILRVWYAGRAQRPVGAINATTIDLDPGTGTFAEGSFVMLSDCEAIDVLMVCPGSDDNTIDFSCNSGAPSVIPDDAIAYRVDAAPYYVGKQTDGPAASNPPTLYRRMLGGAAAEPIAQGIENLQIVYGVDTLGGDNVPDMYVPANLVANWNSVVNVKVSVLMSTLNQTGQRNPDVAPTYVLNGFTITPTVDGRLRRVFNTTIALRNRV